MTLSELVPERGKLMITCPFSSEISWISCVVGWWMCGWCMCGVVHVWGAHKRTIPESLGQVSSNKPSLWYILLLWGGGCAHVWGGACVYTIGRYMCGVCTCGVVHGCVCGVCKGVHVCGVVHGCVCVECAWVCVECVCVCVCSVHEHPCTGWCKCGMCVGVGMRSVLMCILQ